MNQNPKIVVLHRKKLIVGGMIIVCLILLSLIVYFTQTHVKKENAITSVSQTLNSTEPSSKDSAQNTIEESSIKENSIEESSIQESSIKESSIKESSIEESSIDDTTIQESQSLGYVSKTDDKEHKISYAPGIYSSTLTLDNGLIELEIITDKKQIKSAKIKNIDDDVKSMYPLMETAMKEIEFQLQSGTPLNQISYPQDSKYTYLILLDILNQTLTKAVQ